MCLCAAPSALCRHDVTTGETTMIAEAPALQRASIVPTAATAAAAAVQRSERAHLKSATKLQLPFSPPHPSAGSIVSETICRVEKESSAAEGARVARNRAISTETQRTG